MSLTGMKAAPPAAKKLAAGGAFDDYTTITTGRIMGLRLVFL